MRPNRLGQKRRRNASPSAPGSSDPHDATISYRSSVHQERDPTASSWYVRSGELDPSRASSLVLGTVSPLVEERWTPRRPTSGASLIISGFISSSSEYESLSMILEVNEWFRIKVHADVLEFPKCPLLSQFRILSKRAPIVEE